MEAAAISGIGLVTCIGYDAVSSCAAMRAGLTRRAELEDVTIYDEDELEAPVFGAPARELCDGFVQNAAWVRLAQAAIADLRRSLILTGPTEEAFWAELVLLWCLPELGFERFGWPEDDVPALLDEWCAGTLAATSGLRLDRRRVQFFPFGNAGPAQAAAHALDLIAQRHAQRVLLVGTDSWLDRLSLTGLVGRERLPDGDRPTGMVPGEAGACVLLEDPNAASARGARARARLSAARVRRPAAPLESEEFSGERVALAPSIGRELAGVIGDTLVQAGSTSFAGDVLVDLNGEEWRALVWGHALSHLHPHLSSGSYRTVVPALSFGDVGAAAGVLAMSAATRAFERGYARGSRALIPLVSDDASVGAILTSAGAAA